MGQKLKLMLLSVLSAERGSNLQEGGEIIAFCGKCGASLDGGKFCPKCGAPVELEQSQAATAVAYPSKKSGVWKKWFFGIAVVAIAIFMITRFCIYS